MLLHLIEGRPYLIAVMAARRRTSFVQIATNPLEGGGSGFASSAGPKVESLADAMPILADELGGMIENLKEMP